MPISFYCPHCGHHTNVSSEFAGMSGPCVECGKQITVPLVAGMSDEGLPTASMGGRGAAAAWIVAIVAGALLLSCFVCMGVGVTLPAVQAAREAARRAQCQNNLRRIGVALQQYSLDHGTFPPAYIEDEEGNRLHSWRALLLPYLDEVLAEEYDFNEPWDSDKNSLLAYRMPSVFACPDDPDHSNFYTSYVACDGENRFFQGSRPVAPAEITDGLSRTIAVVESSNSEIPWLEPRDSDEDYMAGEIDSVAYSNHPNGANVLFGDGSVEFLTYDIDPRVLRELELINDGGRGEELLGAVDSTADSSEADSFGEPFVDEAASEEMEAEPSE